MASELRGCRASASGIKGFGKMYGSTGHTELALGFLGHLVTIRGRARELDSQVASRGWKEVIKPRGSMYPIIGYLGLG